MADSVRADGGKVDEGGKAGAIAVLHTWNQHVLLHLHIHLVVPGGGLDSDDK